MGGRRGRAGLRSVGTDAFELHLALVELDIVARGVDGRGASDPLAVAHAETRAVPGACDHVAGQRALVQGTPGVGTGSRDGVEVLSLAQQDHRYASGHHPMPRVLL